MRFLYLLCSIFVFTLYSCKEDDIDGRGSDPRLNITEYTFSAEGESLDVYSTVGGYLMFVSEDPTYRATPIVTPPGQPKEEGLDGGWWRAYYPLPSVETALPYKSLHQGIRIEVKANDTGQDRKIPINIFAGDFGCRVNFIQAK